MERLLIYLKEELNTIKYQMDEIYNPENWDIEDRIEWERLEESVFVLEELLIKIKSDFFYDVVF